MKKIWLVILGSLFFATTCFAQVHYALVEALIKNKQGMAYTLNTVTKVRDQEDCARALGPIDYVKDQYQIRTECLSGPEADKLFADVFANKPTAWLYISYKDPNGYETRINTKVSPGLNSSAPNRFIDLPAKEIVLWADSMIETLEKGGIKNAKIIYPVKK